MRRKRTIRESVSNETIYIDKERIPTAHYVFDVRIGDIDFIVTAESGYGDAESEAIDKVVEYCINSIDNEDYYDLLPIFTYDDVIEDFKDFEFDDPEYADEAINDYIMNDFTVALDSNYFIPNNEISVKDVTQSMRRGFRNRRSYIKRRGKMKLQNKRLNEKKAQNADKLNKLNSLIKEEYTIEYGWENPQQEDKEPYWLSNEELRLMADKLIKRFGNEEEFEDFYYNAQEYAEGYISEDALAAFALCDIDEMNDEETYNKAIDEFIAAVWDIKDEDYHLTESMKKAKKKLMKESKELRLIDSVEVTAPEFSEIGYFGNAEELYIAMKFAENNSDGWRLPNESEAKEMMKNYKNEMKEMCKREYFGLWTNKSDEEKNLYAYVPKNIANSPINFENIIPNIELFLIR